MIRISKLTDYAISILATMIKDSDGRDGERVLFTANNLSKETKLPFATVVKILKMLSKAKFITSQRGTKGGYILTSDVQSITIEEVIRGIEGPIYLHNCSNSDVCYSKECCPVQASWNKANDALVGVLSSIKIQDMIIK